MTTMYTFEAGCYLEIAMRDGGYPEDQIQKVFNEFIVQVPSPIVEENDAYNLAIDVFNKLRIRPDKFHWAKVTDTVHPKHLATWPLRYGYVQDVK